MSIDVYEDHIRFLGYHVPLDTSKLPATARDALVGELQRGVDVPDGATDEELAEAADSERERVLDLVSTLLARVESAVDDWNEKDIRNSVEALRNFVDEA